MEDRMVSRCGQLFGLAFLLFHAPAAAQEGAAPADSPGGIYWSFDLSMGAANDPQAAGVYEANLGMEFGARLGLGYAFDRLRLEAQLGYEGFSLSSLRPAPGSPMAATSWNEGGLTGPVMMGNLFYDFGAPGDARPYLGAGFGFASLKARYQSNLYCFLICLGSEGGDSVVSGSDTVAAWQGMAGLSVPLRSGRGEWYIGYRYFATAELGLNVVGVGPVTQEGVQSHSLMLGWRVRLRPG
jgi:opacity protein-like surface antigen